MFRYAQTDETGLCFAESRLAGPVEADSLIPLADDEVSRLGMRWNGDEWVSAG